MWTVFPDDPDEMPQEFETYAKASEYAIWLEEMWGCKSRIEASI